MIQAREEELQITWACSAQSPDLLPDKYKKQKAKPKQVIRAFFEDLE